MALALIPGRRRSPMTPKLMALAAVVVLTVVFLEPCRVPWRGSVPPLADRARGESRRPLAERG